MNLVIHDLNEKDWERFKADYEGWTVISDNGNIHPCIGCFSCWNKTPGECVIRDGYHEMGKLIHEAGEVVVISRFTYGGFSSFVKNVFDRSLGYVLPQFEVIGGETHHQKRYPEEKSFSFIFYGSGLTEADKKSAIKYVKAVCTNIRGVVKDVTFVDNLATLGSPNVREFGMRGKVILLNGSMRGVNANSYKFGLKLSEYLGEESEFLHLKDYRKDLSGLVSSLGEAEVIVLCIPLYVDGLPSQVIRLFETFQKTYSGRALKVYVLSNMGLYETSQLNDLFVAVHKWCDCMHFEYCGGVGLSAGEMFGVVMQVLPFHLGPTRYASKVVQMLAKAIDGRRAMEDTFAEPFLFPRWLYIAVANTNWRITAKKTA